MLQVRAIRTIAQRGVLLVGTAHGADLGSLLRNIELVPLLGGVTNVTLGDGMAKASNGGAKTRAERSGAPCFTSLLEVGGGGRWVAGGVGGGPQIAAPAGGRLWLAVLLGWRPVMQCTVCCWWCQLLWMCFEAQH